MSCTSLKQVVCAPVEGTESSIVSCAGGGCRDISVDKKAMASLRRGAWVSSEVLPSLLHRVAFSASVRLSVPCVERVAACD